MVLLGSTKCHLRNSGDCQKNINVHDGNEQNGNRKKPNNNRCVAEDSKIFVVIG